MVVIPTRRSSLVLEPKKKELLASLTESVEVKTGGGLFRKGTTKIVQEVPDFRKWEYIKGSLSAVLRGDAWSWPKSYDVHLEEKIYPITLQQALFLGEDVNDYEMEIGYDIYRRLPVFYATLEDVLELQKAPEGLFVRV